MLVYTPGSTCETLALSTGNENGFGSRLSASRTSISLRHLASASNTLTSNYAAIQDKNSHQHIIEIDSSDDEDIKPLKVSRPSLGSNIVNGKKRASASLSEVAIATSANKKPRLDKASNAAAGVASTPQTFHRILTHRLILQPCHPAKAHMNGEADPSIYPDSVTVNLDSFPVVKAGNTEIARLLEEKSSRSHPDDLLSSLDALKRDTDLLKFECGTLNKVPGQHASTKKVMSWKQRGLGFYYTLDIHVLFDITGSLEPEREGMSKTTIKIVKEAISILMEHAFISKSDHEEVTRAVTERSQVRYQETNLEWFYSCLPRPPVPNGHQKGIPDRKGKGRARDLDDEIDVATGSRDISPPGLVPHLHPFQSRSVEWMLSREGKAISHRDGNGEHVIKKMPEDATKALKRGTIWSKLVLDDGAEWWFSPTTLRLSRSDPADSLEAVFEGSILAEEMGLGKTVELLSLILLNREVERNDLPTYDATWLAADVKPSNLTLLVCPQAIIGQWEDEITRHAPSLRVLRYESMGKTFPQEDGREVENTIRDYDIVLCDFDTMAADLDIAKKPRLHNTRGNKARGNRVIYRRSMLIGIDWLRVICDEAQMAASTTSKISETASWIPRKYSWAVSGTPIKQTIQDLAGLLLFLRIDDVGYGQSAFQKLLEPRFASVFTELIGKIGIRTVKAQIEGELSLPRQERFIVPVDFSAVEAYNYRTHYEDALRELQIALDATHLTGDWYLDRRLLSRWLHVLRQACFHAQAHQAMNQQRNRNVGARGQQDEAVVQTLDEVLFNLREKNIAELHADQRALAASKVKRAYRLMHDKEECERFEKGLKTLKSAKQELHVLASDIHKELLEIFPEARSATPDSRATSAAPDSNNHHPYLSVFRDTVRDLAEKRNHAADTTKSKALSRMIGSLSNRLRETLFLMHQAVFFIGNGYFGMGDQEDAEAAAYAEAEMIRKQILHADESEASREIVKMQNRLRAKPLRQDDLLFGESTSSGGLQSGRVFDQIAAISAKANDIPALMMQWRKYIIDNLASRLTEEEISAEEYQSKAEMQEKLDIYIEYLTRLEADWIKLVTGNKSTLADNPTVGGIANQQDAAFEKDLRAAEAASTSTHEAGTSKRTQRKQQMNAGAAKKKAAAADPATKLRNELEEQRKSVVPKFIRQPAQKNARGRLLPDEEESDEDDGVTGDETSFLRNQLRELQRLKDRVVNETELMMIAEESARLRRELAQKDKVIEQMRSEMALFAHVYNARVRFFRIMQEFGDSVAELPSDQSTPYQLHIDIDTCKRAELDLDREIVRKIARRRFLDNLKENNPAEEGCLICADSYEGDSVLTICGHAYHEACLTTWCHRSGSRTCPVCRASLARERAWQRIILKGKASKEMDEEEEDSKDSGAPAVAGPSIERATMPAKVDELEVNDDDPSKQLNFLPPEDVDGINDMPLREAALGSKLDMIVKHVKRLRIKHEAAIERYDEMMAARGASQRSSTSHPSSGTLDETPPTEAKILIYSSWQVACDVLAQAFRREKLGFVRLEGSGKKEKAVLEFRENPDIAVFILHARSQAAGLTLTSAQYVILVEPNLQTSLEVQAIARVHRIGQKQATTVFQYIIPNTVDERVALLSLQRKNHTIFSRAHSTGTVHESTVTLSPGKVKSELEPKARKRGRNNQLVKDDNGAQSADMLSEDDLARLLLDQHGLQSLQAILERVAKLRQEAANDKSAQQQARLSLAQEIAFANADHDGEGVGDWQGWDIEAEMDDAYMEE